MSKYSFPEAFCHNAQEHYHWHLSYIRMKIGCLAKREGIRTWEDLLNADESVFNSFDKKTRDLLISMKEKELQKAVQPMLPGMEEDRIFIPEGYIPAKLGNKN